MGTGEAVAMHTRAGKVRKMKANAVAVTYEPHSQAEETAKEVQTYGADMQKMCLTSARTTMPMSTSVATPMRLACVQVNPLPAFFTRNSLASLVLERTRSLAA